MKNESKRIFINDLPETLTQDELEDNFKKYGQVSSIEIKERKELGPNNKSLFFAYVNLFTDDKAINQCFQELSNTKWHGQYVQLQLARESFLDRLRREREESQKNKQSTITSDVTEVTTKQVSKQNGLNSSKRNQTTVENTSKKIIKKYKSSTESESESSESDSESKNDISSKISKKNEETKPETVLSEPEEKVDIVIKSNRGKIVDKNGLKIPSVGYEPIIRVTNNKVKKSNDSESNLKRLLSLQDMKKSYAAQKSFIKNSLSYGVNKPNSKIVFDDNDENAPTNKRNNDLTKNSLFDDNKSEDDSDFEVNFDVKEQFQGKRGQELLELQSKYKHDKRFALDKRFINDKNDDDTELMETEDMSEETLDAEKRAQLKILAEVLGKKITPSKDHGGKDSVKKKTMLRFDPSQPDLLNLEVTVNESEQKKKKKSKKEVEEEINPEPEVSKEVFYKVSDNLKDTFEEKHQFSLLSMFGKVDKDKDDVEESQEKEIKRNSLLHSKNPFKYDSSDNEDDREDIPHKDDLENASKTRPSEQKVTRASPAVFWTEPFFFKTDDYRLQEGLDFLEKIKTENKEFVKIRRDLKGIVKAKVRNNERKNKMFKKKLGGSKRRKHIRIKKALKR